jgi:hypothetical protein
VNIRSWMSRERASAAMLAVAATLGVVSAAEAQLVPTTVTVSIGQDTQVDRLTPDSPRGSQTVTMVDAFFKPELSRIVIKFDQAAITNAIGTRQLVRARLVLTPSRYADSWGDSFIDAFRVTKAWSQSNTTWNTLFPNGTEPFDVANPTVRVTVPNRSTAKVTFDVTKDVAAFKNGTPNNGWLLKDDGYLSGVSQPYHSFEAAITANRPQLIIESTDAPLSGVATLQFPSPGVVQVSSETGADLVNIPVHGRTFATERDMNTFMAANFNAKIAYNKAGAQVGTGGELIQIGDFYYIDSVTGQSVEIEDIIAAIVGGQDGIVTVAGIPYCIREEGCGTAFKAPPDVDRECIGAGSSLYCAKATSWKTSPASRLFVYASVGTKVEQFEGGWHKDCGLCWKGPIPWRCCKTRGSNTLGITNRYQSGQNPYGGVETATRSVSRNNVAKVKEKLWASFHAAISISTNGEIGVGDDADAASLNVAGVCGRSSGQGRGTSSSSPVNMYTSKGEVDVACGQ